jgi:hypothetical protein
MRHTKYVILRKDPDSGALEMVDKINPPVADARLDIVESEWKPYTEEVWK